MAPSPTKDIRVLIVDDSAFMRKVLETILVSDEQLKVVGHAKDGREAVRLAESLKPDVITMDINMPGMDGLQSTGDRGGEFGIAPRSGKHVASAGVGRD